MFLRVPVLGVALLLVFVLAASGVAADSGRLGLGAPADPFHIDWQAFCRTHPTRCSGGDPHVVSDDAAMIANSFPTDVYGAGIASVCTTAIANRYAPHDPPCPVGVGVYDASLHDPLVRIHVSQYRGGFGPTGAGELDGASVYVPRGALPQQASDGHLTVWQPGGTICQFWFAGHSLAPIVEADRTVSAGGCIRPTFEREGDETFFPSSAYAAGDEMSRGFIRPEDIVGSRGDGTDAASPDAFSHAPYLSVTNNRAGHVYPAGADDGQCRIATHGGAMPVEGMVLYLDAVGFRKLTAWTPSPELRWLKRSLGTLHRHGALDLDSSGCATDAKKIYTNVLVWGSQSYALGDHTNPLDAYIAHFIHPHDASYLSGNGAERAIYANVPGSAYTFALLYYRDVPGLGIEHFHWLARGCAEVAVRGASSEPC